MKTNGTLTDSEMVEILQEIISKVKTVLTYYPSIDRIDLDQWEKRVRALIERPRVTREDIDDWICEIRAERNGVAQMEILIGNLRKNGVEVEGEK